MEGHLRAVDQAGGKLEVRKAWRKPTRQLAVVGFPTTGITETLLKGSHGKTHKVSGSKANAIKGVLTFMIEAKEASMSDLPSFLDGAPVAKQSGWVLRYKANRKNFIDYCERYFEES